MKMEEYSSTLFIEYVCWVFGQSCSPHSKVVIFDNDSVSLM